MTTDKAALIAAVKRAQEFLDVFKTHDGVAHIACDTDDLPHPCITLRKETVDVLNEAARAHLATLTEPTPVTDAEAQEALDKLQNCGDWLKQGFTMDTAHTYFETIRSALTQAASGGWQPIETAPNDKRIIVWSGQEMYAAHWARNPFTDDEAWIVAAWGDEGDQALIKNPTHWMPLPAAPNQRRTRNEILRSL
jgi:hypothetical protein